MTESTAHVTTLSSPPEQRSPDERCDVTSVRPADGADLDRDGRGAPPVQPGRQAAPLLAVVVRRDVHVLHDPGRDSPAQPPNGAVKAEPLTSSDVRRISRRREARRDGFSLKSHHAAGAVDGHLVACRDGLRRARHPHDRGDAVLPRDDGAMAVGAAHLHHEPAGREEQRRPARVGGRCHQDLARLQASADRVEDDARRRRHDSGRCGRSAKRPRRGRRRRGTEGLEFRPVGQQHPRHVPAPQLGVVPVPSLADRGAQVLSRGGAFRLVEVEEEDIVRLRDTA